MTKDMEIKEQRWFGNKKSEENEFDSSMQMVVDPGV
jgi:hypothetical protein